MNLTAVIKTATARSHREAKYVATLHTWNDDTQECEGKRVKILSWHELNQAEENYEVYYYHGCAYQGKFEAA